MVIIYVQKGTSPCIHTLVQKHKYSIFLDLKGKIKVLNSAFFVHSPRFSCTYGIIGHMSFLQITLHYITLQNSFILGCNYLVYNEKPTLLSRKKKKIVWKAAYSAAILIYARTPFLAL